MRMAVLRNPEADVVHNGTDANGYDTDATMRRTRSIVEIDVVHDENGVRL